MTGFPAREELPLPSPIARSAFEMRNGCCASSGILPLTTPVQLFSHTSSINLLTTSSSSKPSTMGKQKKANQAPKAIGDSVKSIKEGQVKKHKVQKFKKTPAGKVPLIATNGKANGDSKPQKPNKQLAKQNQQNQSPSAPNNKNKNKNKNKSLSKSPKEASPQKKKGGELKKKKEEPEEDSDSDEDINEGISISEDISNIEDESEDSSEEEEETPNILGASLANDSDEDDEDFQASDDDDEDDEEEEEEEEMKKGIKKFKGSKKISAEESSEEDDDDEEDDDEDEGGEADESVASQKSLNSSAATDDSDEDEDEEDGPGLKDLLGESLVDQEDDEDFDGEAEDDDEEDQEMSEDEDEDASDDEENDESQDEKNASNDSSRFIPTEGNPRLSEAEKAEQDTRTIYVGNVPKDLEEKVIKQTFKKFGEIQSLRVRGAVPEDPKMKLKVANIKKKFHPLSKALCVYVVYKSKDSVDKALAFNGQKLGGNYIRVDRIGQERQADPKKSVFLGNVPWDIEDNDLWELFSKCGKIDYVRTIRDRHTGACRGIAYVNFADADGATLALDLDKTKIRKRELRVNRYDPNRQKKSSDTGGKKRKNGGKLQEGSPKKKKMEVERATENSLNAQKRKAKKAKGSPKEGAAFQGQKAEAKKKGNKKGNKLDKKKKNIAAKLLAPKKGKASQ